MAVSIPPILGILMLLSAASGNATFLVTPNLPDAVSDDADLLERYWDWLKQETGAPEDLPWPTMTIESMPSNLRMVLIYPTTLQPNEDYRIKISTHAVRRAEAGQQLLVLAEIAHELVHHILLLKQHEWDVYLLRYDRATHGHCDAEFQRLAQYVGEVVWQSYHSDNLVRDVVQMNRKSCWESGHMLAR